MAPALVDDAALRAVLTSPIVESLVSRFPRATGASTGRGLHVDDAPAPVLRMAGTARVSLVRVYCGHGGERRLLGQIHAIARAAASEAVSIAFLVHDAEVPVAREAADGEVWWNAVVARHLETSGALN